MGEGMVFVVQLDANVVALDIRTGREVWKTRSRNGATAYSITSAPLYYDGIVYSGISGGELGNPRPPDRARRQNRQESVRTIRYPAPAKSAADSWPAESDAWTRGGGPIWNTPALDPQLGLLYFATAM